MVLRKHIGVLKLLPATFLEIMRHINGAYTTYFNVKRARKKSNLEALELP